MMAGPQGQGEAPGPAGRAGSLGIQGQPQKTRGQGRPGTSIQSQLEAFPDVQAPSSRK